MTDPYEDDLFGDLGVHEIISSKKPLIQVQIEEAWKLWESVTNRPPSSGVNERFRLAYKEQLEWKFPQERLLRCVRAASFLPIRPRDPHDIKRVLFVLQKENVEIEALALLDSGTAEPYLWEWDEAKSRATPSDVELACGTDFAEWTIQEHESAGLLISSMDAEQLILAGSRVKAYTGKEWLFPSDIIRWAWTWKNPDVAIRVAANGARDTYAAGEVESKALADMDLTLDTLSEKLLLKGCPIEKITTFYNEAPDGYWDAVLTRLDEDQELKALSEVYDGLQSEFEWHPNNREMPEW